MAREDAVLRIGEVARRTGTTVSTLRAWERRYDLLDPARTDGGHRLYSESDVERVATMQALLDDGWSAAAAARQVLRVPAAVTSLRAVPVSGSDTPSDELVEDLHRAIEEYDTRATNRVLDRALALLDLPAALERVVYPVLHRIGDGWEDDPSAIAQEHHASNALRPRLLRLVQTNGLASRRAVAASPEAEDHDIGLLGAAAVLSSANWSVRYLGARTPNIALEVAVRDSDAQIALVAAQTARHAKAVVADPPRLDGALLVLGGPGWHDVDTDGLDALVHRDSLSTLPLAIERELRDRRDAASG